MAHAVDCDSMTALVPGAGQVLAHLSDGELLTRTRALVGKTNQLLAALLVHLGEVEARGIHRMRRCASLYAYCIYELRFSEDAASRRASAARLVKRFPLLIAVVAAGELHLTGLLMLGPHLTEENHVEVLGRAKFRTKKEIAKLVRTLAPLPEVPDRVEALRPEPGGLAQPTWQEFVQSLCPPVRELPVGERPRDWANDDGDVSDLERAGTAALTGTAEDFATSDGGSSEQCERASTELPPLTGPQLYQMQFTTSEEHVQLVERAKALLSQAPTAAKGGLGDLHLQAMRLLVEMLEKKRFGAREASRKTGAAPRQRGRHVSAVVRRAVFERDAGRCTFLDDEGKRCAETHRLQFHHVHAFAKGGEHTTSNLVLRCAAHNALAAEQDFGREHVEKMREGNRHESRRAQKPP